MGTRTGVIRYNMNETGRTFTGTPRKVDIDAAMRVVNGAAVQEAVKNGDIVGYIGHQNREKFGLDTPESVIVNGTQVILEPAVRTIYIKCFPDGTLEHEQEFLDTAAGRIGQRLWESGAYGFSSVFYAPDEGGMRTPKNYFGMDLVRGPNFVANRSPAMLDSVSAGGAGAEYDYASESAALMDSIDRHVQQVESMAASISKDYVEQCRQNDELVEQNARLLERLRQLDKGGAMLDNAGSASPSKMERGIPMDRGQGMLDSAARFMAFTELPGYQPDPTEAEKDKGVAATIAGGVKSAMSVISSVIRG
ncbi:MULTISPECIES: hypothetical protein [unclassified Pseudomonas]|uniref:hypothetical protein n=1 Tax=unclassified Pseudomonas TaxID=196821 RepID=UPI000A1E57EC|nr:MULTISPECIES: hypothetical protein [unclassified Pseudomonas]